MTLYVQYFCDVNIFEQVMRILRFSILKAKYFMQETDFNRLQGEMYDTSKRLHSTRYLWIASNIWTDISM